MMAIGQLEDALTAADSDAARQALVEAFWNGAGARSPVVAQADHATAARAPFAVTFLWRDAHAVAVLVGINRITATLEDALMTRVAGTDIWYRTVVLDADWCGSYTLLPLDAAGRADLAAREPRWAMRIVRERGALDPRNPRTTHTHGGRASFAALPAAPGEPWLTGDEAPRGADAVAETTDRGRRVWVHGPATPTDATPRPVIVVLDGEVWQRSGYAVRTIDALVAAGSIRAPYLLLVECGGEQDRMRDLAHDGGMCDEIVSSILPWARARWPISSDPADVMVTGESLGGLTALRVAFTHSEHVGLALGQSSSLWQNDLREAARDATHPVRIFATAGRHEPTIVAPNRALAEALGPTPHEHRYVEVNGGHDMGWWRGQWGVGVAHLLGS